MSKRLGKMDMVVEKLRTFQESGGSMVQSQLQPPRSAGTKRRSQVTGRRSQVTGHRSQVPGPRSQVPGPRSQVAGRRSQVAGPRSQVVGRRSQVAGHRKFNKKVRYLIRLFMFICFFHFRLRHNQAYVCHRPCFPVLF